MLDKDYQKPGVSVLDHPKKLDWVAISAMLFLAIPLEIFILTHLVVWLSIPLSLVEGWIILRVIKSLSRTLDGNQFTKKELVIGALILGIWVLISGIGGYMFQNYDHQFRNAIFRDLIQYDWPVIYSQDRGGVDTSYGLVYYTGFWLPSALVGKWLGWKAANFCLFIWAFIGVFLTTALIKKYLRSSFLFSTLLIICFSGMDFLGVALFKAAGLGLYPRLWPPISHLEWWSGAYQYSSFTTQLFWVFNQAVPCWLSIILILSIKNPKVVLFFWGLSFFFAPIPAIGLLPYVLLIIFKEMVNLSSVNSGRYRMSPQDFIKNTVGILRGIITTENMIGGGLILILSALYFSSNPSVSKFTTISMDLTRIILLIIFISMDFLILWLLLKPDHKKDLYWYTCGLLLIIIPLFTIAGGSNLMLRASIPSLFFLMLWSGEALLKNPRVKNRTALILVLIIGSLTPVYEVNRSIFRTVLYYKDFTREELIEDLPTLKDPVPFSLPYEIAENAHPNTLTADSIQSLSYYDLDTYWEMIGKTKGSLFFEDLARKVVDK